MFMFVLNPNLMAKDIRKVKRCLFGMPTESEKDSFQEWMQAENRRNADRFKENWNFDVVADRALSGEPEWTEVPMSEIPSVYLKGYTHKCKPRSGVSCRNTKNLCYYHNDSDDSSLSSDCVASAGSESGVCGEKVDVVIGFKTSQEKTPHRPDATKPSTESQKQKSLLQGRIIDFADFPVRKKRSRSLTPELESSHAAKKTKSDS